MYTVRLLVVFLMVLMLVFVSTPVTREQAMQSWETARPTVVALMDGVYAIVRTMIAGDGHDDRIDDGPVAPDVDFDRVVTMNSAFST